MPAHPRYYERIDQRIADAKARSDQAAVDHYLEQRYDVMSRATNWDADQWGLDEKLLDSLVDQMAQ